MHETKYPGTLDKLHRECEELLRQAEKQQQHGAGPSTSTHEEPYLGEPQEYPVEETEAVMGRDSTANSHGAVSTTSSAVACRVPQLLPETPPVDDAVRLPHARLRAGVEEMHLHNETKSRATYYAASGMVAKPMVEDVDNNSVSEQQVLKEGEQQTICLVSQGGTESVLTIYAASLSALVQPQLGAQLSPEPISLQEAERRADWQEWKQAMQKEIDTIHEQQTWELAELPPNVRTLGVKWVLVVKTTATGAIERYKARLVVQGFRQIKGVDFDETYAPVARFTTFRVLMALLAGNNLHARQLDVKNAFLYGVLDDTTVYVKQPPHFEDGTHRVCKLLKSLYGLKQAPLVWYSHIEATLRTQGWTRLDTDWGLFIHEQQGLWLLLYVDDIIILGPDEAALDSVLTALEAAYKMKRENFSKYLRINVAVGLTGDGTNREVTISLAKYCSEVQARYGLTLPTKAWVPLTMDPSKVESTGCDTPAPVQVKDYQSQVGSLQWAASRVRPDVKLSASILARGSKNPSEEYFRQCHRALQYLVDTAGLGITYSALEDTTMHNRLWAMSDATWVSKGDGRSQSGWVVYLNGGPICWNSAVQRSAVLSSAESEMVAVVSCAQEVVYLRRLLSHLGHAQSTATIIYVDNEALVTGVTQQPVKLKAAYRMYWLQEQVRMEQIRLVHVPGRHQWADILTKPLPRPAFEACRRGLLIREHPSTVRLLEAMGSAPANHTPFETGDMCQAMGEDLPWPQDEGQSLQASADTPGEVLPRAPAGLPSVSNESPTTGDREQQERA